jgi:predicted transcriptional regulator
VTRVEPRDLSALELDSRRRIFAFVVDHPGAYLREMHRALGGSMGALEYHLVQLESAGLVRVDHEENKRFFPATMDPRESRALALLRLEPARRLLVALLSREAVAHGELMERAQLRSPTVSYHAGKLIDAGLVVREKRGRESWYRLQDPSLVLRLLVQHRASFVDRLVDAFLDGFEGMGPR